MNSICQDYGQTFTDKRNFAVLRQNHAKYEIKCHICETICIEKKIQNHIKLHKNFECANCGESPDIVDIYSILMADFLLFCL